MEGRYSVARGTYGDGLSWVVWAKRNDPRAGDLLSMIRVTDSDGRILHGGGGAGPPLYPGHVLNVTTGGSEEGPRVLLARVHPDVRRVVLTARDGAAMEVPIYDCAEVPEVRFASLLLPRDLPLGHVAGFGADGTELERFDLGFHQSRWDERR